MSSQEEAACTGQFFVGKGGHRIYYLRTGAGMPLLLLHGWPGYRNDWQRLVPLLSPHFDLIIPDFRGFGQSDKPDLTGADYSKSSLAEDMISLLDELDISSVMVLGYDIGGSVAQTMAREFPDRVVGLVISNPTYPGVNGREFAPEHLSDFWYVNFNVLPLAAKLVGYHRDTVTVYLQHFYKEWSGPDFQMKAEAMNALVDSYAAPGAIEASLHYYKAWASALQHQNQKDGQESPIEQPTIVLWGDQDPTAPYSWSDNLAQHFTNLIALKSLKAIGHFVPLEAPESFAKAAMELRARLGNFA